MNIAVLSRRMRNASLKLIKPLLFFGVLLALYAGSGFFIIPAVLKNQLPKIVHQQIGREAVVERITFDPFAMSMAIHGFQLKETDGQIFAAFERFSIDVAVLASLTHWHWVVDQLELIEPFVRIAKSAQGEFNFSDLVDRTNQPDETDGVSAPFAFRLKQAWVRNGSVVWEDLQRPKPLKESIDSIDWQVSELTTVDSEPSPWLLSWKSESIGLLSWDGTVTLMPLASQGVIKLEKALLKRIGHWFLDDVDGLKIKSGELNLVLEYAVQSTDDQIEADLKSSRLGIEKASMSILEAGQSIKASADSITFDTRAALVGSGKGLTVNAEEARWALVGVDMQPASLSADRPAAALGRLTLAGGYSAEIGDQRFDFKLKRGQLDLERLKTTYQPHDEPLEAELGRVKVAADLTVDSAMAVKIAQGRIELGDLKLLAGAESADLIEMPSIAINGIKVDTAKRHAHAASVVSTDGVVKAWLNPDGQLNYLPLFAGNANEAATETSQSASLPWQFLIEQIALEGYRVEFTDNTIPSPVRIDLADLKLSVEQFTDQSDRKFPVQLQTRVNDSGAIKMGGHLSPSPLSADLDIDIDDIVLKTFQPYLQNHLRLDLVEGDVSAQGKTLFSVSENDAVDLKFNGNAQINRLVTRDQIQRRDFVKWRALELGRITVDLADNRFEFEDVSFDKPYLRVMIKKDSTTNFNDILPVASDDSAKAAAAAVSDEEPAGVHFKIGKIEMKRGASDFADYSLILPFVTQMNDLDGVVTGLSSEPNAVAELALQGKVYNLANVAIAGNYHLNSGDSSVELNFRHLPLPLVTPYMAEFAGYKIERGQMSLDLNYTIDQGQLNAQNNLLIDQFTLGEKVENPKAVSLPLSLAIALLKDANGQINLALPISGSLDDPEFSVGSLVMKALGNMITKIATSPFRAIASMFDGEQDLSVVQFEPGKAKLAANEQAKLDMLAKALQERLALKLEVRGAAFEDQDWPALSSEALNDQLKAMRAKELRAEGRRIRAEYIELSEEEERRLLAQLFIERFPLLAEYTFFGRPALKEPEQGDFYEIARQKLEAALQPDPQRLHDLAVRRAGAISNYLVEKGGIPGNRIFLLATELNPTREEPGITTTLSLGTR